MTRFWKLFAVTVLAVAIFAPVASAAPRIFVGGYVGPVIYGPGFYGWYGPVWPYPYAYPAPTMGMVKINTPSKEAQVYVDGAYAGTVKQLRTFPLKGGEHDIQLRNSDGQVFYQQHVTVLAGRTLTLNA